ncbi:MAG: OmpH family outer membrane protein [Puniceicoccales bacterium]|jgi:Skp family chaperone for outer membrane proteins|nr:OmpH family outer membrane protein [Puniceicoccales bacterium]
MFMSLVVVAMARLPAVDLKNAVDVKTQSDVAKSGIKSVSSRQITDDYDQVKKTNEELAAVLKAVQSELTSMLVDYKETEKILEKTIEKISNPVLNEDGKKKLEADAQVLKVQLEQKGMALNDYKINSQNRILEMKQEKEAKIVDTIKRTIETVAEVEGYAVVVDADNPAILFCKKSCDITDKVLEKLNAAKPKPVAEAKQETAVGTATAKK